MKERFNIQTYMTRGVAKVVASAVFATAANGKEAPFMRAFAKSAFPGDEKSSGGCVAAGRGFFHINAAGGAEPCPFSPFSDCNVRDTSIREALRSPLFFALNTQGLLKDEHIGGCTLYANREQVAQLLNHQEESPWQKH